MKFGKVPPYNGEQPLDAKGSGPSEPWGVVPHYAYVHGNISLVQLCCNRHLNRHLATRGVEDHPHQKQVFTKVAGSM